MSNNVARQKFLAEQVRLLTYSVFRRRYSTETIITAFTWSHISSACYDNFRKTLILLHKDYWRNFTSMVSGATDSSDMYTYLKTKAEKLSPAERIVMLQMDEMYVAPKLKYVSDSVARSHVCGQEAKPLYLRAVATFVNVMLNNYSKLVNDNAKKSCK